MADPQAEVRVRLVFDDVAAETTAHLQSGLGQIADASAKAGASLEHTGKEDPLKKILHGMKPSVDGFENLAYAAGLAYGAFKSLEAVEDILKGVRDLTIEAFEAAREENKEIKKVASSLMMMSSGAGIGQIKDVARTVHDELEDAAIQMGVSTDEMGDAFNTIAERSNKSVEEVQRLAEAMALAGRVTGAGAGGLSEGFAMMESGMIRARNPVVQLIAATDTLHGNAKQVAAQLQKMSPEKALELGEKAVEKMAEKAKGLPLSFGAMKQSLTDIKTQVLEQAGAPILAAVTKELGVVREFFLKNQDLITEYAVAFGNRVGEFIKFLSEIVKGFLGMSTDDLGTVGSSLDATLNELADKWDEIKDDGYAIAKSMRDVVEAAKEVFKWVLKAADRLTDMLPGAKVAKLVAGTGQDYLFGKGAFTTKGGLDSDTERALKKMNRIAADVNAPVDKLQKAQAEFRKTAEAAGMSAGDITHYMEGMRVAQENALVASGADVFDKIVAGFGDKTKDSVGAFVDAFNKASEAHNTAALRHAAMVLEGSVQLQNALLDSGAIASGAIVGLGPQIKDATLRAKVTTREKQALTAASGKGPTINMNGGQTFTLKQDFRDQDPDRIFLQFRRDVSKAVMSRTQPRTALFGGG